MLSRDRHYTRFRLNRPLRTISAKMERNCADGNLLDDMVENMDERHCLFNMKNNKTLDFIGQEKVNYSDIVSGGEGMTMVLRIVEGPSSKVEGPIMIFTSKSGNHPIQGTPDDVEVVSYRTGPKVLIDSRVFVQWLKERRPIDRNPAGRTRVVLMGNR